MCIRDRGGIPQQLMDAFAAGLGDYETTHKVLIMTTQVTYEGSDVGVYEVGKRVRNRFRFLEAHDMTIEAVVTKSMWLLAQNCESFDQLQQRFYRCLLYTSAWSGGTRPPSCTRLWTGYRCTATSPPRPR